MEVTPTICDLVKNEITDLFVRSFIIPSTYIERISVRRSRRNQTFFEDDAIDVCIRPCQKRARLTPSPNNLPNCSGNDGESDDSLDGDPISEACHYLSYGTLRKCLNSNDEEQCLGIASLQIVAL